MVVILILVNYFCFLLINLYINYNSQSSVADNWRHWKKHPWVTTEWVRLMAEIKPGQEIEGASLVAQSLKHLPEMRETWVWFLGQEDPLEKGMATHSSTLAWRIPWTEQPGRLQSMGLQRVGHDWATSLHFSEGIRIQQTVLVIDPGWDVTHCTFSAHKIFVTRLKIWGFFFKVRKSTFIL